MQLVQWNEGKMPEICMKYNNASYVNVILSSRWYCLFCLHSHYITIMLLILSTFDSPFVTRVFLLSSCQHVDIAHYSNILFAPIRRPLLILSSFSLHHLDIAFSFNIFLKSRRFCSCFQDFSCFESTLLFLL